MRAVRAAAFADLDALTLYRLLELRVAVFVVEQACAYPELDGRDLEPATVHLWIDGDDGARRLPAHPGRARRHGPHRPGGDGTGAPGRGPGRRARRDALALTAPATAVLDAQSHLTGWYEDFGFEVAGAEYLDDGIPHTPMRLVRPPC